MAFLEPHRQLSDEGGPTAQCMKERQSCKKGTIGLMSSADRWASSMGTSLQAMMLCGPQTKHGCTRAMHLAMDIDEPHGGRKPRAKSIFEVVWSLGGLGRLWAIVCGAWTMWRQLGKVR